MNIFIIITFTSYLTCHSTKYNYWQVQPIKRIIQCRSDSNDLLHRKVSSM